MKFEDLAEDEEEIELTEEQEDSLDDIREAIHASLKMDVPPDLIMFLLMKVSTEVAIAMEMSRGDFRSFLNEMFEDTIEDVILQQAKNQTPLEE